MMQERFLISGQMNRSTNTSTGILQLTWRTQLIFSTRLSKTLTVEKAAIGQFVYSRIRGLLELYVCMISRPTDRLLKLVTHFCPSTNRRGSCRKRCPSSFTIAFTH